MSRSRTGKVSVLVSSRAPNQMSRSRLGLGEMWEGLVSVSSRIGKPNVSVSSRSRTPTSRLQVPSAIFWIFHGV